MLCCLGVPDHYKMVGDRVRHEDVKSFMLYYLLTRNKQNAKHFFNCSSESENSFFSLRQKVNISLMLEDKDICQCWTISQSSFTQEKEDYRNI